MSDTPNAPQVKAGTGLIDLNKIWGAFRPVLAQNGWTDWTISKDPSADLTAMTDMGNARTNNEDAHAAWRFWPGGDLPAFTVLLIADGVGGEEFGEVASNLTIRTLSMDLIRIALSRHGAPTADDVKSSLRMAHDLVRSEGARLDSFDRMATTAVVAVLDGCNLHVTHVGDSRAYLFRQKKLQQITHDHSLMAELIRLNRIQPEEARTHKMRHMVTRVVGKDEVLEPETASHVIEDGDQILLCTDGLTDMLEDPVIEKILQDGASVPDRAARLIQAALSAGGRDNVTVVLAESPARNVGSASQTPAGALAPALAICHSGRVCTYIRKDKR